MRKLLTALVLLLLISGTAFAIQPREVYLGNLTAIAWLEGETTLNVAIANESNARTVVSISTETWDTRWRPSSHRGELQSLLAASLLKHSGSNDPDAVKQSRLFSATCAETL